MMRTYFLDNRVEYFSSEQVPRDSHFTINEPDRWVIGVVHVETCEVEDVVCHRKHIRVQFKLRIKVGREDE